MATRNEFEKFKSGMNPTTRSLGAALAPKADNERTSSKTTDPNKKQVSHYMDRHLLESLGVLEARSGKSMSVLYEEAIFDLLQKYNVR